MADACVQILGGLHRRSLERPISAIDGAAAITETLRVCLPAALKSADWSAVVSFYESALTSVAKLTEVCLLLDLSPSCESFDSRLRADMMFSTESDVNLL